MNDTYYTIETPATGYFKDKGSKFYSFLYPVKNEEEVKEILSQLKKEHHSARHYCYAWRLGTEIINERANDDGEPSSTAGRPILGQLLSHNLTNALLVVVRYFGGVLLGVGGLISAYKNASINAIENAEITEKWIESKFELSFEYPMLNTAMQTLKKLGIESYNTDFRESCKIELLVRKSEETFTYETFKNIYGIAIKNID